MNQLRIAKQITNRESKSLDNYFKEIAKVDLISADEETDLAKRIREGDPMALEKLIKANLRFVVSVAKQYQTNYMSLGDLISEGNIGLIKAASRFDETRGFKFISYAVWWIRQSIMQALAERSRVVRLPLNRISTISKISKISSDLEQKFERDPTAEELAEVIEIIPEEVTNTQIIAKRQLSIDAPFDPDDPGGLLDILANRESTLPDSELMRESLSIELNKALGSLTDRESHIIVMYYGLNGYSQHSLNDIAEKLKCTKERVRQIKEKATRNLRHKKCSSMLKSYLE